MGTILKFAQATRDLEDSFQTEDIYKSHDLMLPDEAISRAYSYGNILAMLLTAGIICTIGR